MIFAKLAICVLGCIGIFTVGSAYAETKKITMSYADCLIRKELVVNQLGVRASDIIPIVNSSILNVTKYCTVDGSVVLTCSKPDNAMVIVNTANKCR